MLYLRPFDHEEFVPNTDETPFYGYGFGIPRYFKCFVVHLPKLFDIGVCVKVLN